MSSFFTRFRASLSREVITTSAAFVLLLACAWWLAKIFLGPSSYAPRGTESPLFLYEFCLLGAVYFGAVIVCLMANLAAPKDPWNSVLLVPLMLLTIALFYYILEIKGVIFASAMFFVQQGLALLYDQWTYFLLSVNAVRERWERDNSGKLMKDNLATAEIVKLAWSFWQNEFGKGIQTPTPPTVAMNAHGFPCVKWVVLERITGNNKWGSKTIWHKEYATAITMEIDSKGQLVRSIRGRYAHKIEFKGNDVKRGEKERYEEKPPRQNFFEDLWWWYQVVDVRQFTLRRSSEMELGSVDADFFRQGKLHYLEHHNIVIEFKDGSEVTISRDTQDPQYSRQIVTILNRELIANQPEHGWVEEAKMRLAGTAGVPQEKIAPSGKKLAEDPI